MLIIRRQTEKSNNSDDDDNSNAIHTGNKDNTTSTIDNILIS